METIVEACKSALPRPLCDDNGQHVGKPVARNVLTGQRALLVLSNGHGEDEIAVRILDELRSVAKKPLDVSVWPLVGEGHAYRRGGWPIAGPLNCLPSGGFGTIDFRQGARDLRAGWIGAHWRQARWALKLAGRYRFVMAVGDIVPILAARLISAPYVLVGCAKSAYFGWTPSYSWPERLLLRRNCRMIYARDDLTANELQRLALPARFVGNPMMDGLAGTGEPFDIDRNALVVAMIAGSRDDAEANTAGLLDIALHLIDRFEPKRELNFLFPAHAGLDFDRVCRLLQSGQGRWRLESKAPDAASPGIRFRAGKTRALLAKGRFADCLRQADVAIGMAGTANEQAVGIGLPLIAVPGLGAQGERYVRMKMNYFGDAAITVARDPASVAEALQRILEDPQLRCRMSRAGRARMGEPGGSAIIARDLANWVE